jgi:hypothetical protein
MTNEMMISGTHSLTCGCLITFRGGFEAERQYAHAQYAYCVQSREGRMGTV